MAAIVYWSWQMCSRSMHGLYQRVTRRLPQQPRCWFVSGFSVLEFHNAYIPIGVGTSRVRLPESFVSFMTSGTPERLRATQKATGSASRLTGRYMTYFALFHRNKSGSGHNIWHSMHSIQCFPSCINRVLSVLSDVRE